ncbi:hypothetical protein [uncultured Sphingomonas sp.]|uniref:hypothetical protein n=1 Tax=uncultured Sphingomonas sp. TaxID=158754 RepID=UPI0025CC4551|nr:hypothetical protein [uncultured Sphingomonas sp.]
MTVRVEGDRVILSGPCLVEDAEPLLLALQAGARMVDWTAATRLHGALVQLLLAACMPVVGQVADPFLRAHVAPLLQAPVGEGIKALRSADYAGPHQDPVRSMQ